MGGEVSMTDEERIREEIRARFPTSSESGALLCALAASEEARLKAEAAWKQAEAEADKQMKARLAADLRAEKAEAQRDSLREALEGMMLQFGDNYALSAVEAAKEALAEVEATPKCSGCGGELASNDERGHGICVACRDRDNAEWQKEWFVEGFFVSCGLQKSWKIQTCFILGPRGNSAADAYKLALQAGWHIVDGVMACPDHYGRLDLAGDREAE